MHRLLLALTIALLPTAASAAEEFDLEALLNTQVEAATKRRQSLAEAPAVVDVITAKDLRERGYQSVAEALRALPGFYVVDDFLLPNVGVRGIPSGQRSWSRIVKVMIDSQPVPYRPEATNFLGPEFIPIDLVSRIEVIRGPGSALYGADAFLGVVNVVTKRGEDLAGTMLATEGGQFAGNTQIDGTLAAGYPLPWGNSELLVGGTRGQFDRSGLRAAASSPLNPPATSVDLARPASLFARLGQLSTPVGALSVDGSYQRLDSSGEFQDWRPLTHQTRISLENQTLRSMLSSQIGGLSTRVSAAYSKGNPTPEDRIGLGREDYLIRREMGSEGWDLGLEGYYALGDRDGLTLGLDWSRTDHQLPTYFDVFTDQSARAGQEIQDGPAGARQRFDNLGLYAQGIVHLFEDTGLTVGLRHDGHSIYGNVLNSRAGLVRPLGDGLVGKVLYGTAFKAPSPQQLFGRPLVYGDIIGNPDLLPERAQTVEAALSYAPSPQLDLLANAYYTHVTDKIGFVTQRGNPKAVNQNQMDSVGLEGGMRWRWGGLHGQLNASVQQTATQAALDVQEISDSDGLAEAYPTFMANAGVGAPLGPLAVYLEARHVGAVPSSQSNFANNGHVSYQLSAATLVDLNLTGPEWSVAGGVVSGSLRASNLLDATYAQPGFGGVDYPGRGRALTLRMRYVW